MIRASFNSQPIKRKLQNRARGFAATLPEQLRRAGRLVAVSLARSTQPYGDNEAARILGETRTAGDVRRCYATYAQVYQAFANPGAAAGYWKAVQRADWARARQLIDRNCPAFRGVPIGQALDPSLHQRVRNKRGRVAPKQRALQIVSPTSLNAYVKEEVALVGFGKAGWASCTKQNGLGGARGIPDWAKRHQAPAVVIVDENPEHPTITLRNNVRYAALILDPSDKAEAVQIGLARLAKALVIEERKIALA